MKKNIFDRRIPTLLALVLLVLGIGATSLLTSQSIQITGFASPDEKPQNVRISNITNTGFTITYTSAKSVLGTINYGSTANSLKETAIDDRDQKAGSPKPYQVHSITLQGLTEQTAYYFSIASGGNVYVDNGKPYTVTTAKTLSNALPDKWSITGKILLSGDDIAKEVLVYLTTDGGQSLSTLSDAEGKFSLSTLGMKNAALDDYLSLNKESKMNMIILSGTETTQALFVLQNSNPLPDMTLSQDYDFTQTDSVQSENNATDSAAISFPFLGTQATELEQVSITSPKKDEHFSDQQPTFDGNGTPNQKVDILIESETEVRATVAIDKQGTWSYRPDKPLEPGNHTVTITTRDSNGLLRTLSRSFVVFAEGSQFTEPSVSPSAPTASPTLTPAPTLTATPTITQTPSQTPSPTAIVSPTETPKISPTELPSPIIAETSITPRPTIQPTGSSSLSSLTLISIAFTISGIILLILTRGGVSL